MADKKFIKQYISAFKNLPTLPQIIIKLIQTCNDSEKSLDEISRIINKDPSLSNKIMGLVNSVYYGLPIRITNVDQAVSFLGRNAIKNIVFCASIQQVFVPARENTTFNLKAFWFHSLKCAFLAKLISVKIGYNDYDEAFLAGLLHDIGKLVLWVNFPKEYEALLLRAENNNDILLKGEKQIGATHYEIGAGLIGEWQLSSFLADSILYHHESEEKIIHAFPLVQIIFTANLLARADVVNREKVYQIAERLFDFNTSCLNDVLSRANDELEDVAGLLSIEIDPVSPPEITETADDYNAHSSLVSEVKNASFLIGTLENLLKADNQEAILQAVKQGIQIQFDLGNTFFFIYQPEKDGLVGKSLAYDKRFMALNDLIVPLQVEKSLLVTALISGKPVSSFNGAKDFKPVLVDVQLIQFAKKEGLLCLPMVVQERYMGVIVIALDKIDFFHLKQDIKLLNMFAIHAAHALYTDALKHQKAEKIQEERIQASTTMAHKIIHEVNNPLSIIKNYLKIIGKKLGEFDLVEEEIQIINEEIDSVSHILHSLTVQPEKKAGNIEPMDLNAFLSNFVKIIKDTFSENSRIKLHLDLDSALPKVNAERYSLQQIIINLIKNAVEAMDEEGNLYITTRYGPNHLKEDFPLENLKQKEYVEILVADDGPGMPEEIKGRLFDAFVSTKKGHSGLGLSIVYRLIKSLNGSIACTTEQSKGTSFKLKLPTTL